MLFSRLGGVNGYDQSGFSALVVVRLYTENIRNYKVMNKVESKIAAALTSALALGAMDAAIAADGDVKLKKGWNFVSANALKSDTTKYQLKDLLASDSTAKAYIYDENGWSLWSASKELTSDANSQLDPNQGVWIEVGAEITINLSGLDQPFDGGSDLIGGWNMVGVGTIETVADLRDHMRPLTNSKLIREVILFDGGSWNSVDLLKEYKKDTTALIGNGAWVRVSNVANFKTVDSDGNATTQTASIAGVTEAVLNTQIAMGTEFYAQILTDSDFTKDRTDLTIEFTDTKTDTKYSKTVNVAQSESKNYEIAIFDRFGKYVGTSAADGSKAEISGQVDYTSPIVKVYGLPQGKGSPSLLQDVNVKVTDASGNTVDEDLLRDPVSGVELQGLSAGANIHLTKEGYLPVEKSYAAGSKELYFIMHPKPETVDSISTDEKFADDSNATASLARRLDAAKALSFPSSKKHDKGAALYQDAGWDGSKLNKSIAIGVDAIRAEDHIFTGSDDKAALEAEIKKNYEGDSEYGQSYYASRYPTLFSNNEKLLDVIGDKWSWEVVGGTLITVDDNNTFEPLDPKDRHEDILGNYADIVPYQGELMGNNSVWNLMSEMAAYGGNLNVDYRVTLDAYAKAWDGTKMTWKRVSKGVQFVKPPHIILPEDKETTTIASQAVALSGDALSTVGKALPEDQFLMRPLENKGRVLLDKDSNNNADTAGGFYDLVYVVTRLTPAKADITIKVTDQETSEPLPSSLVTMNGSKYQLTDEKGETVFKDVIASISNPTVMFEALRTDHYRNIKTLDTGMITDDAVYEIEVEEVGKAAIVRGRVDDNSTGSPIEAADVKLVAPAALYKMEIKDQEFVVYNDPQANFKWEIRPAKASDTAARILSGATASKADRFSRILVEDVDANSDYWYTLKDNTGAEGGSALSFNEILNKITDLDPDQKEKADADYFLTGNYDLRVTTTYDIDMDGNVDFTEQTADGMEISVFINPELFDVSVLTSSDGNYAIKGSPQKGEFVVQARKSSASGTTVDTPMPYVAWDAAVTWVHPSDSTIKYELVNSSGIYSWKKVTSFTNDDAVKYVDYDYPILLTPAPKADFTANPPGKHWSRSKVLWSDIVGKLSSHEIFTAFLDVIPEFKDANNNGYRFIDQEKGGFSISVRANIFSTSTNAAAPDETKSFEANLAARFSEDRFSVLSIPVEKAVPAEGRSSWAPERTTATNPDGYYNFTMIDMDLGAFNSTDLSTSLVRVGADKSLYYGSPLQPVGKFSRDIATTSVLEDVAEEGTTISLAPIPRRDLTVTVTAVSQPTPALGATVRLDGMGITKESKVTDSSGTSTVTFSDLLVGSYQMTVVPASGQNYAAYTDNVDLVEYMTSSNDPQTAGPQAESVNLTAIYWESPALPIITADVTDPNPDGTVVVEGKVEEYFKHSDEEMDRVPYGWHSDTNTVTTARGESISTGTEACPVSTPVACRIRDAVYIDVNGRHIPVQLSDDKSTFRATIDLIEGSNNIKIVATNGVGSEDTSAVVRQFVPGKGMIFGYAEYDHDADSETAHVMVPGATITMIRQNGDQLSVFAESKTIPDGSGGEKKVAYFSFHGLEANELVTLSSTFANKTEHYVSTPVSFAIQPGVKTDAGTIQLEGTAKVALGNPTVVIDSTSVDEYGNLTVAGRVGNYDGKTYGTGENAGQSDQVYPIGLYINDFYYPVEVSRTKPARRLYDSTVDDNLMWFFKHTIRLRDRTNRVYMDAVNLGGYAQSPTMYIENPYIDLRDLEVSVTGLSSSYGAKGYAILRNLEGSIISNRTFVTDGSNLADLLAYDSLDVGIYGLEFFVEGFVPVNQHVKLSADTGDSPTAQTETIAMVETQIESNWVTMSDLSVARIKSYTGADKGETDAENTIVEGELTNRAQVKGTLVLSIPKYQATVLGGISNLKLKAMLQAINEGHTPMQISLPEVLGTEVEDDHDSYDEFAHTFEFPFGATLDLHEGINRFSYRLSLVDAELMDTIGEVDVPEGDLSGAMTLTLSWDKGEDLDINTYYYKDWEADADTEASDFNPGKPSWINWDNRDLGTSTVQENDSWMYGQLDTRRDGTQPATMPDWEWNYMTGDFIAESQNWGTFTTANDREVVDDGTYLVYLQDIHYSGISDAPAHYPTNKDGEGVTIRLAGPGIEDVVVGPFNTKAAVSPDTNSAWIDKNNPVPAFVIQVDQHKIVNVEAIEPGQPFPDWVQGALSNSATRPDDISGYKNGNGKYMSRTLPGGQQVRVKRRH